MHFVKQLLLCLFLLTSICEVILKNLNGSEEKLNHVLIISTVDGILHGIDYESGSLMWTIDNVPLVSQSLSKLEFMKDGFKYRLIPSLDGQLYMLPLNKNPEGLGLHALPITADALFSSSFQLSTDSVLVGGKEQRAFGFNPYTGEVRYRCNKEGCDVKSKRSSSDNQKESNQMNDSTCDMLICRRLTHTVRAVDVEEGHERWNFSVGIDEMLGEGDGSGGPASGAGPHFFPRSKKCTLSEDDNQKLADKKIVLSWDVVNGLVMAYHKVSTLATFKLSSTPLLWKRQLSASPSRAWLLNRSSSRLSRLSLFAGDLRAQKNLLSYSTIDNCPHYRSLFLGKFSDSLYIQLEDGSALKAKSPRYLPLSEETTSSLTTALETVPQPGFMRQAPLHNGPLQPHNVLLPWLSPHLPETHDIASVYNGANIPTIIQQSPYNFLFQKMVFGALFCVILHLLMKYYYLPNQRQIARNEAKITKIRQRLSSSTSLRKNTPNLNETENFNNQNTVCKETIPEQSTTTTYESRYEKDFEHQEVLGRGGFGVVLRAQHRVDGFEYAVKRVRLRYSPSAESALLKEVRAFARLEDPGIARYYQAWFERPPRGWQELHDSRLSIETAYNDELESGTEYTKNDSMHDNDSLIVFSNNNTTQIIFDNNLNDEPIGGSEWLDRIDSSNSSNSSTNQIEDEDYEDSPYIYLYIQMHLYGAESLKTRLMNCDVCFNKDTHNMSHIETFIQITQALNYLHEKSIIHRDLKPSNILFDENQHARIVDFGLAVVQTNRIDDTNERKITKRSIDDETESGIVGTETYMSPEQYAISSKKLSSSTDIYSLGIMLLEMTLSNLHGVKTTQMERISLMNLVRISLLELLNKFKLPPNYSDLIISMLQKDPLKRPNCSQILNHSFFR